MKVTKRDGSTEPVKFDKVLNRIKKQTYGLNADYIDSVEVAKKVINGLYDGVSTIILDNLAAETAASLSTIHYDYSMLASRIAISSLHKTVSKKFSETAKKLYEYINPETGESAGMISDEVYEIILKHSKELDEIIVNDRDYTFNYFGYKTLERSYLLKIDNQVAETPQHMYMRVAVGIWKSNIEMVEKTYELLSTKKLSHATPTLFNSGTKRPQNSSCFLVAMKDDSISGIYETLQDIAKISQSAGGVGLHIHNIRAKGAYIKGTNGRSNGIIPMLKVFNETARYVDQGGGKRKGSIAVYLEPWHADVYDFIELRKNRGKEEMRARDLFLALWTPDLFMQRVKDDAEWTLMCPSECPGLSDVYDDANNKSFTELYTRYESQGKGRKVVKARELWAKILEAQIETGTPYVLYKDAANRKSNQQNIGVIKSSNLCCIAGDQRVPTARGMHTIKELYELGSENMVVGREKIETASEMFLPRPNAEMLQIITSDGYTHKVTPDHKVWVVSRSGSRWYDKKYIGYWKEAKDLVPGDEIGIQTFKGLFGVVHKPNEAYIAGLVAGDGTFSSNLSMHIDIWNENSIFLNQIEEIVANIIKDNELNTNPKYNYDKASVKASLTPKFNICNDGKTTYTKYRLSSRLLCRYFDINFNFNKDTKMTIPDFVWKGDEITVSEYLRGVYYADATITKNGKYGVSSISLSSIHKKFLEDIQLLLLNFGIKSSIRIQGKSGMRNMPDGKGGKKEYLVRDAYRLLVTSKFACKQLNNLINIKEYRNSNINFEPVRSCGFYNLKSDTTKFVKTIPLPNEDAYCLTVNSKEHSWIVNGIVTKNTEILEVSTPDETAVCNLASLPVNQFIDIPKGKDKTKRIFNFKSLYDATYQATLNLNQVIDVNYYPTKETLKSNMKHRPIGLGVQGLADAFAILGIAFDSDQAKKLNKQIFETIYFSALTASHDLAVLNGSYESFEGSPISKGIFQFDMWENFNYNEDLSGMWNWEDLRDKVKLGVRNSLLVSPMPTASTAMILDNNECFEPFTSNVYKRNTLSGEYIVINKYLIDDLISLNLWNDSTRIDIITNNGSVQNIDYIPQNIKDVYKTVWEISQKVVIDMAADRGMFICQSQSMNLFIPNVNSAKLNSALFYGWEKGLKTGMYYMRTTVRSEAAKSLGGIDKISVSEEYTTEEEISCSLDNPDDCIVCGS